eukprot:107761-Chlamydomonas_euryale.AAC.5
MRHRRRDRHSHLRRLTGGRRRRRCPHFLATTAVAAAGSVRTRVQTLGPGGRTGVALGVVCMRVCVEGYRGARHAV